VPGRVRLILGLLKDVLGLSKHGTQRQGVIWQARPFSVTVSNFFLETIGVSVSWSPGPRRRKHLRRVSCGFSWTYHIALWCRTSGIITHRTDMSTGADLWSMALPCEILAQHVRNSYLDPASRLNKSIPWS
jgi:hypothetical protein